MQESLVVDLLHYNAAMTSAMLNEYFSKGWNLFSVICTNTNHKINTKQLQKTIDQTIENGHINVIDALNYGILEKACVFTVILLREKQENKK